jgi:hypothetical protein
VTKTRSPSATASVSLNASNRSLFGQQTWKYFSRSMPLSFGL